MERNTAKITPRAAGRWGLVVGVLTIPVDLLVSHFVDQGTGMAAGVSLGMLIGGAWAFWHQRRHAWFWMALAALSVIHGVLIVVVPWNNWMNRNLPAPELWPIGIADFAVICGFIKLVEKAMAPRTPAAPSASADE